MKLLLMGNHTCGNRGDSAILRGLVSEILSHVPDAELTVTSRYPVSSSFLLGREIVADPFHTWYQRVAAGGGLTGRLRSRFWRSWVPLLLLLAIRLRTPVVLRLLPRALRRAVTQIREYDAVIQVGGSFFIGLYGLGQFAFAFAVLVAERPLFLLGHSMGPFHGMISRLCAATLLSRASMVALRERESRKLLKAAGLPLQRVKEGADTAWLVPTGSRAPSSSGAVELSWATRPLVGITLRELAPFDRPLGIAQNEYEEAFAELINEIIDAGYDVAALSTCTGIESYHRDDRINALRIGANVRDHSHYRVIMSELTDIELGYLLGQCRLVVGTRLHGAIIAMNFGTPAITLSYEHKTEGVMAQLGLPLARKVSALVNGDLAREMRSLLARAEAIRKDLAPAVEAERLRARRMVEEFLAVVSGRSD